MNSQTKKESQNGLYQLEGRVPVLTALPFGLQHILAMFVSNLIPIAMIAEAAEPEITRSQISVLLQNAIFTAGAATLIQLYPVWKIGSGLPIVMGLSFTYVSMLVKIASEHGMGGVAGAVIISGIAEGLLGLFVKNWKTVISPITAACVVLTTGISLFSTGARSFGGGYGPDFGSLDNIALGLITITACMLWSIFAKKNTKHLSVLIGMIAGTAAAAVLGRLNLQGLGAESLISLPRLFPFKPEFYLSDAIDVSILSLVSAAGTVGNTSALISEGLNRSPKNEEISGSVACDGFASALAGIFGCPAVTSLSQNIGLINMTKVVNKFTLMIGASILITACIFPQIGTIFSAIPNSVLGGCTIIMFGSIMVSGMMMVSKCGFSYKNILILSASMSMGLGFTAVTEHSLWNHVPYQIQAVFSSNPIALVFVISAFLNMIIPSAETEEA